MLKSGVTRAMFPHGLGHHMGLDVHDVRSISVFQGNPQAQGLDDKDDFRMQHAPCTKEAALLEPGMVLMVELGICTSCNGQLITTHY